MKRTLICLGAMLLLSAGIIAGGAVYLAEQGDDIRLAHTLLAGDPAAARGITLTLPVEGTVTLQYWLTTVDLGAEELAPETVHTFYPQGVPRDTDPKPQVEFYVSGMDFIINRSNGIDFDRYMPGTEEFERYRSDIDLILPAKAVAERTKPGETRTEELRLADFYDHYAINGEVFLPNENGVSYALLSAQEELALSDYFRLSIPEDAVVEVSATRDEAGNVIQVMSDFVGMDAPYDLDIQTALVEEGVFLSFAGVREIAGDVRLPQQWAERCGVYYLPFSDSTLRGEFSREVPIFALDRARKIHDLPLEGRVLLLPCGDGRRAVLYAREAGELKLRVFDAASGQCVQAGSVFLLEEGEDFSLLGSGEGFWVLTRGDDFFRVVEDSGNALTPTLSGTLDRRAIYGEDAWGYRENCAYDGRRLVMTGATGWADCALYVQVYDEGGLAYGARIDHSLDVEDAGSGYSQTYRPDEDKGYPWVAFAEK